MGAKDNLNEAMYSMFGVGKAPASSDAPAPAAESEDSVPAAKPAAQPTVQPVIPIRNVTYLAPGSCMEGKLKCQGDVNIAGIFKGDIEATGKVTLCSNMEGNITAQTLEVVDCRLVGDLVVSGTVVLGPKSIVEGKITAGELICSGRIKGDLDVKGNISLDANTSVEGNIVTSTMSMEAGAVINGSLVMNRKA